MRRSEGGMDVIINCFRHIFEIDQDNESGVTMRIEKATIDKVPLKDGKITPDTMARHFRENTVINARLVKLASVEPNEHEVLAQDRRMMLGLIFNTYLSTCQYTNVVYIGGNPRREPPFVGMNTVYINPINVELVSNVITINLIQQHKLFFPGSIHHIPKRA